jgi:putative aminopeptidase FrvX
MCSSNFTLFFHFTIPSPGFITLSISPYPLHLQGVGVSSTLLKWLKEAAKSNNIPYQLDVGAGGTTDASAIHLSREGVPSGVIGPPTRYIHTPVSVISMSDLENSAKLVARAVEIVNRFF